MSSSEKSDGSGGGGRSGGGGGLDRSDPQRRRLRASQRHRPRRRQVYSSENGVLDDEAVCVEPRPASAPNSDEESSRCRADRNTTTAVAVSAVAASERISGLWRRALLTAEAYSDRLGRLLASFRARGSGGRTALGGGGFGPGLRPTTEERRIREEEALERQQQRAAPATVGKGGAGGFAFTASFAELLVAEDTRAADSVSSVAEAANVIAPPLSPLPSVSSRVPMTTVAAPIRS